MADLNEEQVETAKFAFDIYDSEGNGTIDAVDLGRILYALNLNPTMATIEKLGGTKKKGEKKFTLEEFLPIYSQELKDKDQGVYEDFLECLKLYDKQEDGTMLGAELSHMLISLGERLDETQANEVLADCLDPEDEDGFVNYAPFLKKMMVMGPLHRMK
uniref:Myosin light chain alkali n=1 Tax=Cacopsylla melanoneura TaxID=428564 RepID=A0A8D8U8F6_9HEMI